MRHKFPLSERLLRTAKRMAKRSRPRELHPFIQYAAPRTLTYASSSLDRNDVASWRSAGLCEMPSSRAIARGGAPAPKCNVISLLYPPHGQPLGRHPSLDRLRWSTGRQLYADLRNATLLPVAPNRQRWTASSERWMASIQNAGQHQFTKLAAISSERLDGLPQNRNYRASAAF